MPAVGAVEEAEPLLAVRWIVGGVEIEQDLAAPRTGRDRDGRTAGQQSLACTRSRADGAFSERRSVGWGPRPSPSSDRRRSGTGDRGATIGVVRVFVPATRRCVAGTGQRIMAQAVGCRGRRVARPSRGRTTALIEGAQGRRRRWDWLPEKSARTGRRR